MQSEFYHTTSERQSLSETYCLQYLKLLNHHLKNSLVQPEAELFSFNYKKPKDCTLQKFLSMMHFRWLS